jgi:phosphatidylinositol alpha-1,6-mannosyltransferase
MPAKMRRRILIMASTFPRSLEDTMSPFVLHFAKELAKTNDVAVLAPHDKGAKFKEVMEGVAVYRFPYGLPRFETLAYRGGMVNRFRESWLAKLELPIFLAAECLWALALIWRKHVQVVSAHWLFPQGLVAVALRRFTNAKVVVTTHGGDVAILQHRKYRFLRRVFQRSDAVTFVSATNLRNAQEWLKLGHSANLKVLPMGIYLPHQLSNAPYSGRKILFIGRLVAIKGLDTLLRAMALAKQEGLAFHLDVLGDGPLRSVWEALVDSLGLSNRVIFHGHTDGERKLQFLAEAAVVVVPSIRDQYGYEEGLPVVALEAMSYSRVLIVTDTGSMPEVVENGTSGIVIPPGDPAALSAQLVRVSRNPDFASHLQAGARAKAEEYSWGKIGERFAAIVAELQHRKRVVLLTERESKKTGPTTWAKGLSRAIAEAGDVCLRLDSTSPGSIIKIGKVLSADVVHAYHVGGLTVPLLLVTRMFGKRVIYTVHGDIGAEGVSKKGMRRVLWMPLHNAAFLLANTVTFPSDYVFRRVEQVHHFRQQALIVPNAIDVSTSYGASTERSCRNILCITNFNYPEKARGLVPLIEAFGNLRKELPELSLTIVGGGRLLEQYGKEYGSMQGVTLTGHQRVGSYLKSADIMVHSSFLDNAPYVILEAMSYGLLVIGTRTGGIPEMLPGDAVCEPTAEGIAEKLGAILRDEDFRRKLSVDEQKMLAAMSWQNVVLSFRRIYA